MLSLLDFERIKNNILVIKAKISDKKLVVAILVEAFAPLKEKNSINFIVKQDEKYLERMEILMEYLFDDAIRSGEIFLSDNKASCLLVSYANKNDFSFASLRAKFNLAFKCIGIFRVFKVLKRQAIVQRNYPKTNHIRPVIFAVKNEYKGTATAAKLIMQVFKEFKNNTLPVIVDTASKDHVRLYQKFGLQVFNTEEDLGFPIYLLRMN